MAKEIKAFNPFYVLLVLVGIVFSVTACGYGVMTVRLLNPADPGQVDSGGPDFVRFMNRHGMTLLAVELAVLAAATIGAIGTDDYWTRRAQARAARRERAAETSPAPPPQEVQA